MKSEIKASLIVSPEPEQPTVVLPGSEPAQITGLSKATILQDQEEARSAAREGNYAETIVRYDRLIEGEPNQFSHFLGRAQARFLNGDRPGALLDIAAAEALAPGHPNTQMVRQKIELGLVTSLPVKNLAAKEKTTAGHVSLGKGDGAAALGCYEAAEALGFAAFYCAFNKAMACTLLGNYDVSDSHLDTITAIDGSHFKVNVEALRQINAMLRGNGQTQDLDRIVVAIAKVGNYDFSLSPLRNLLTGLTERLQETDLLRIHPVVQLLRQEG